MDIDLARLDPRREPRRRDPVKSGLLELGDPSCDFRG